MSSPFIKQTLVVGTLVIVLGLPGMIQGRRVGGNIAAAAPDKPGAAKQGNIDIPPALMPAVKRAMKSRKQLLQAKMAVLKAAQHLQSEVKKLEASSKASSGKGRQGKAPSMNPKNRKLTSPGFADWIPHNIKDANELPADSKTNIKTQKSINPTGRSGSVHQIVGKSILGLLLTDIFNFESIVQNGAATKGTVSKTGTISNAKNAKAITASTNTAGMAFAPFKGRIDEVLSEEINKVQLQLNIPVIQGNKFTGQIGIE